jgi:hypothetical protein
LRQQEQTPCYQPLKEGSSPSLDSCSGSELGPSRSQSPALSTSSSSSATNQEEPYSAFAAAIDEAFQNSARSAAAATATQQTSTSTSVLSTLESKTVPAPASAELEQACLQLCIALLDHKLHGKVTDSIVVGFLAVNGINHKRTGFQEAVTATSALSGLVKLAQLLVIQHALCEHKAGQTTYPANLIAELQDQFMTYGSSSPMNLILNLQAYGAVVRNNTTAAGFIKWSNNRQDVSYKGVPLNMKHLR